MSPLSCGPQFLQVPTGLWSGAKRVVNFPCSLYKKGVKTTPGTWYIALRDKPPEKNISSFQKHFVLNLECRILFQVPSDSFILYFNVIFHGK